MWNTLINPVFCAVFYDFAMDSETFIIHFLKEQLKTEATGT